MKWRDSLAGKIKTCPQCKLDFDCLEFKLNGIHMASYCKSCRPKMDKIQNDRKYQHRDIEAEKERMREWKKNHPDKVRLASLKRYAEKKDYILEANRNWWKDPKNKPRIFEYKSKRLANKLGNSDGTVDTEFIRKTLAEPVCYYCEEVVESKFRTMEHKQPISKGGLHSRSNIVMACSHCNYSKQDRTEAEYMEYRKLKIQVENLKGRV